MVDFSLSLQFKGGKNAAKILRTGTLAVTLGELGHFTRLICDTFSLAAIGSAMLKASLSGTSLSGTRGNILS